MRNFIFIAFFVIFQATVGVAQSTTQVTTILGGDPNPDRTVSQYQSFCGANSIFMRINSDKNSPTAFVEVGVNGQNYVDRPEYAKLKSFIATLKFPYVTQVKCNKDDISVFISGTPIQGGDNGFRVIFPISK